MFAARNFGLHRVKDLAGSAELTTQGESHRVFHGIRVKVVTITYNVDSVGQGEYVFARSPREVGTLSLLAIRRPRTTRG